MILPLIPAPKPVKTLRKKPKVKNERKSLVRDCDSLVREILHLTETGCFICGINHGRFGPDNRVGEQAGHYKSRTIYPLRWNLKNCHLNCSGCNFRHEHDSLPFTLKMIERFGKEGLEELQQIHDEYRILSKTMTTVQIREIKEQLETKLATLWEK